MNRIEELELTVQMLVDTIREIDLGQEEFPVMAVSKAEAHAEEAENILLGFPCNCTQFSFPHKRTRECFRRYNGQTG